jgi:hypothetical protein
VTINLILLTMPLFLNVMKMSAMLSLVNSVDSAISPVEGRFIDPAHPECPRTIMDMGTSVNVNGVNARGSEKCNWITDSTWGPLPAEIYDDDIVVDFSSTGKRTSLLVTFINIETRRI